MRNDIYQGKGFAVLRGLDAKKYSKEDMTTIYLGVQAHIANRFGRQDKKGNMLGKRGSGRAQFMLETNRLLVHIIADDSSKQRAEHHRHSTSPIVSQPQHVPQSPQTTDANCERLDFPQRGGWRHHQLAHEKRGQDWRQMHHRFHLHCLQCARRHPPGPDPHAGSI